MTALHYINFLLCRSGRTPCSANSFKALNGKWRLLTSAIETSHYWPHPYRFFCIPSWLQADCGRGVTSFSPALWCGGCPRNWHPMPARRIASAARPPYDILPCDSRGVLGGRDWRRDVIRSLLVVAAGPGRAARPSLQLLNLVASRLGSGQVLAVF